jgi:hypothetical protein
MGLGDFYENGMKDFKSFMKYNTVLLDRQYPITLLA